VSAAVRGASLRRVGRALEVARAALHRGPATPRPQPQAQRALAARLEALITEHPTFGYRRLSALLRFREGWALTPRTVYRVLRQQGWGVHQRPVTPSPRVQGRRSQTEQSNVRWAMDVTHIYCGRDGWGHLAAVIDGHDRELIGYEFALRG